MDSASESAGFAAIRPISLGAVFLISGCIAIGHPGAAVPLLPRSDGLQNIEVHREKASFRGARSYFIVVNDQPVSKIRSGETVRFGLEPGQYSIGLRCPNAASYQLPLPFESWPGSDILVEVSGPDTIRLVQQEFKVFEQTFNQDTERVNPCGLILEVPRNQ